MSARRSQSFKVHAIPLTLVAGAGHLAMGNVDFRLLGFLLLGSIPGVLFGSLLSTKVPQVLLRGAISTVLVRGGFEAASLLIALVLPTLRIASWPPTISSSS